MNDAMDMIDYCSESFLLFDGTRFTVSLLPTDCYTFGELHDQIESAKATYAVKVGKTVEGLRQINFRCDSKAHRDRLVNICIDKAMSL